MYETTGIPSAGQRSCADRSRLRGTEPAASTQSGPPEAVESGKSSVAYVEELRIGTTAAIDGANVMTENGIFGKLNYNAVVTAPFVVTDENGKVQPFFMTGWELSGDFEYHYRHLCHRSGPHLARR